MGNPPKEPSCSYPKLSASDVMLKAEELRNTKQTLEAVLSKLTGKPLAKTSGFHHGLLIWITGENWMTNLAPVLTQADIVDAVARDRYMSVQEAAEIFT